MEQFVYLLLGALAFEAAVGYPQAIYQRAGHPVTWIGALIAVLEELGNRKGLSPWQLRLRGIATLAAGLSISCSAALLLQNAAQPLGSVGIVLLVIAGSSLLAQRSLYEHVGNVASALDEGGLAAARVAVAQIVGRDTQSLDEAGVARAAIESLAENFADGVVAPALWLGVGGLPGGVAYKTINTADSMIGHKSERYRQFGWAAARLDDLVNLPASRLAVIWLAGAALLTSGADARGAIRAALRDAPRHRSPNAGWPEAAMAGALQLKLAGPRIYDGKTVDDAFMGDGRAEVTSFDIRAALRLYVRACLIQFMAVAVLAIWLYAG